jgi:5'-nucleotidase
MQNGVAIRHRVPGHLAAPAAFQYLAANVVSIRRRPGAPDPAGTIREVEGIRIGFVGMTLQSTPQLVMPSAVEGLRFEPEAATANRWVRVLKRQGVRTIVVLIHEGGVPVGSDYNGCAGISGPILAITEQMSDDIDVIVSGHTHRAYNCTFDGKLVTSAAAFGRIITAIDLAIDREGTSSRSPPAT